MHPRERAVHARCDQVLSVLDVVCGEGSAQLRAVGGLRV
jgi:hypothetical protein